MRVVLAAVAVSVVSLGCGGKTTPSGDDSVATTRSPVVRGEHGRPIAHLAVTEDGELAVTADSTGNLRLWPTLDGRDEPIALHGVPLRDLAVVRDDEGGRGIAIAGVDTAGQLDITRWTIGGIKRGHAQSDAAVIALAAARGSFVAVTDDRAVVVYSAAGTARGRLVPDPGSRVASIAAREGHALALIESGASVTGRWIDLATASWGEPTGELGIATRGVVLSPDHARVAGIERLSGIHVIVDLAKGSHLASPCKMPSAPPLGFSDATTIVCFHDGVPTPMQFDGAFAPAPKPGTIPGFLVLAGTRMIGVQDRSIAWASGTGAWRYLGYRTEVFPQLRFEPEAILVGSGDQRARWLDRDLRASAPFTLPAFEGVWLDIATVDARTVLVLLASAAGKQLALVDRDHGFIGSRVAVDPESITIHYDRAQHLAVVYATEGRWVTQLGGMLSTIGAPVKLADTVVEFVDPAKTGGAAFLGYTTRFLANGVGMKADVALRRRDGSELARYTLSGEVRGVDRAGHVYVTASPADVAVFDRESEIARFPIAASLRLVPDALGDRVAIIDAMSIKTYDAHGVLAWAIPMFDAQEVSWTMDSLVVKTGGGLARLDPATGGFLSRQCGWNFGAWDAPVTSVVPEDDHVCDVAP